MAGVSLHGPGRVALADEDQHAARQHDVHAQRARRMRAAAFDDELEALAVVAHRMPARAEGLGQLQPLFLEVGHVDLGVAQVEQCHDGAHAHRARAGHQHRAGALRRHQVLHEADAVRGGADGVQQQRRELVLDVVGHGQQALLGHGQILGIAAGAVPADQHRLVQAHLRVAAAAAFAVAAMHRDVDQAAAAVERMARLLHHAEDLVAGREGGALDPELGVRAAQRRAAHAQEHLAGGGHGTFDVGDRDGLVAMEDSGLHEIGS